MNTEKEKIIRYESDEAARKVTVTGWVSSNKRYYGSDEQTARYDGCTHTICEECGGDCKKLYTICSKCRSKRDKNKYLEMPFKEWDGDTVLYSNTLEIFIHYPEELIDYCDSEEIKPEDQELIICEPEYLHTIDMDDYYCDELPEDQCLSDCLPNIAEAFDKLNKLIIESKKPISWHPGKFRTTIKDSE